MTATNTIYIGFYVFHLSWPYTPKIFVGFIRLISFVLSLLFFWTFLKDGGILLKTPSNLKILKTPI